MNVAACDDRTPNKDSGSSTNYVYNCVDGFAFDCTPGSPRLGLFAMAILVEYAMLDLNVQMAKAKHHVLVKHTH